MKVVLYLQLGMFLVLCPSPSSAFAVPYLSVLYLFCTCACCSSGLLRIDWGKWGTGGGNSLGTDTGEGGGTHGHGQPERGETE